MATANADQIVETLSQMSVVQLIELTKQLETTWGVSATPVVVNEIVPPAPPGTTSQVEQTEFEVVLIEAGSAKINVIKEIRLFTGCGLKESKDFADNAPRTLKVGVPKAEAEDIKARLIAAGAKVELK